MTDSEAKASCRRFGLECTEQTERGYSITIITFPGKTKISSE